MPTGYDENLLASVPATSRADRQAGYNLDLLENREPTPTLPGNIPTSPSVPDPVIPGNAFESDVEYGANSATHPKEYAGPEDDLLDHKRTTFIWPSTRAKIILALIVLIILAAVIGGVVGGTVGKSHHKHAGSSSTTLSQSSSPSSSSSSPPPPAPAPASTSTAEGAKGGTNIFTSVAETPSALRPPR